MADTEEVLHFVRLPPNDPNDTSEQAKYDCSRCALDVFHLSWHAQNDHGTLDFTVDNTITPRDLGVVGSLCGINGCSFPGNHEGNHSWQAVDSSLAVGFLAPEVEVVTDEGNPGD